MKRLERNEGAATSRLWGVTETLQRQQALCPRIIYLAMELIKDLSFFLKTQVLLTLGTWRKAA